MKALAIHGKEDIRWEDRETPTPGDGEVRLRVNFSPSSGLYSYVWGEVKILETASGVKITRL